MGPTDPKWHFVAEAPSFAFMRDTVTLISLRLLPFSRVRMLLSFHLTPLGASYIPLPIISHQKHRRLVAPYSESILLVKPSLIVCSVSHQKSVPSSSTGDSIASPENGYPGSGLSPSSPFPPISAAKKVVLVRHGQSTWNAEGRIQGSSNFSVLTLKGEAQAETSRQMLLNDNFDVCFHRCKEMKAATIPWTQWKDKPPDWHSSLMEL